MATLATEMTKLKKKVEEEQKNKNEKVQEGTKYVKDAREDLQKICRVLLQKKLENEDLLAEVSHVKLFEYRGKDKLVTEILNSVL